MSKGLEALENLCNQCEFYQFEKGLRPKKCPFNKKCVFKERIEKELKALEVIKENLVVSYDENDKPCLMLGIKVSKDKLVVIHETYDKGEIDLLKGVLL